MTTRHGRAHFPETVRYYDLNDPTSKRAYNRRLFHTVARRYDLVTRFLSFGQDQRWKRLLVSQLRLPADATVLDIACGTGDLTRALAANAPQGEVVGLDLSPGMLARAARRLAERGVQNTVQNTVLVEGDMTSLPFEDQTFDAVTGGYALRNAPSVSDTLRETHRVLKPGAHAAVLEFRKSPHPRVAHLQLRLLAAWGGLWGRVLHGNPEVYAYIATSLSGFPDQHGFEALLHEIGFARIRSRRLLLGFLAITRFTKPL